MITGIILASGFSRRMKGEEKLLLKVDGIPLIERVIRTAQASRVDDLILVYRKDEICAIARRFGVRAFPSIAYLDTEGELITIVPGYIPPETFLPMLRYIKKECYKQRMSFEDFLKKQEECD